MCKSGPVLRHWALAIILLALPLSTCLTLAADNESRPSPQKAELPLPGSMPLNDYERLLYRWLMERKYQKLNWHRDKTVRDTGPFINTQYYGTHPAARIFYSPEVVTWLENRREGELPDGSMIIKEMFIPPAVLYQDMRNNPAYSAPEHYQAFINSMVFAWTVIVRDRSASQDGWFWANPMAPGQGETIDAAITKQLDTLQTAPASEFGAPCLRCHASAESEFTFSDINNIEGLSDQEPLRFLVDTSWRSPQHFDKYPLSTLRNDPYVKQHYMLPTPLRPYSGASSTNAELNSLHMAAADRPAQIANDQPLSEPDAEFIHTFDAIKPVQKDNVRVFPGQWHDQVLPAAEGPQAYFTSDNCLGCHGGLGGEPYGVTMFLKTGPGYGDGINVSEYGEWRWSPMGLAGRDPIFHAQLESEMALLERDSQLTPTPLKGSLAENQQAVSNTCLSCHGAMGQRQLSIDAAHDSDLDPDFKVDYFYLTQPLSRAAPPPADAAYIRYGTLAREGISCAICHHIDQAAPAAISAWNPPAGWLTSTSDRALAYSLFHNSTGRFVRGPSDQFFGPFANVAEKPMARTLGVTPVFNPFIGNSQLCGSCHTINLPNIGATDNEYAILTSAETNPALQNYPHTIEQATFLEWQNSIFARNQEGIDSRFASCQDCHMPRGFESLDGTISVRQITTQIAAIQDVNFPQASERLPNQDIAIPLRDDYRRHEHVGLNVFLLEMFDQFPDILGVDKTDYMTGASNGVDIAIENMIRQAQQATATIAISELSLADNELKATVALRNLTGHRFPSGVAFRRAFVEFLVLQNDEIIWGSGRTNSVGVIVDAKGQPLETEFLTAPDRYQPHHQVITHQNQVQIYEELNQNAQREFTTSFIHRVHDIKDNRLLPDGWRSSVQFRDQGELFVQFFEATDPKATGDDPDYQDQGPDFKGGDHLVYQAALPEGVDPKQLSVRATLYSQAIPPYWLKQRFSTAPEGQATQRLYYMASRLDLRHTPMADWKLKLVSTERPLSAE